jgi:hypothetical protein
VSAIIEASSICRLCDCASWRRANPISKVPGIATAISRKKQCSSGPDYGLI